MMHPTHAASKPVAMIPNCAATRHGHFVPDGSGQAYMDPWEMVMSGRDGQQGHEVDRSDGEGEVHDTTVSSSTTTSSRFGGS